MPQDVEPFLLLILPQITSPVTTRRKKSRLKKLVSKIWRPTEETCGYAQATSIAIEINCIARCKLYGAIALFLAAIIRGGSRSEKPLTQK